MTLHSKIFLEEPVSKPRLYTFRRCPYAIRARMALAYAQINIQQCEVDLKNKPQELIEASVKATVPVLILADGRVIDESMDIIMWALTQSDPDGWLNADLQDKSEDLIYMNDVKFKPLLDKYKYSQNSEKDEFNCYGEQARVYLEQLNSLLTKNRYLLADHINVADIALFPFVRQFYKVDPLWFEQNGYKHLEAWLHYFLNSELFLTVMKKSHNL